MGRVRDGRAAMIAYLSLGSNIGDRRGNLLGAVAALDAAGVSVLASSSVYETEPVGLVLDQPEFLNAVLRVAVSGSLGDGFGSSGSGSSGSSGSGSSGSGSSGSKSPGPGPGLESGSHSAAAAGPPGGGHGAVLAEALLDTVKGIERELGREPGGVRHGPRVIDIDILLLGELVVTTPRLNVPHAGLVERRFVLVPLLELAPGSTLPGEGGEALATVLERVDGQAVRVVGPPLL